MTEKTEGTLLLTIIGVETDVGVVAGRGRCRVKVGEMTGQVVAGEYHATVSVFYTTEDYTIDLKEASEGLRYDGEVIHKRSTPSFTKSLCSLVRSL